MKQKDSKTKCLSKANVPFFVLKREDYGTYVKSRAWSKRNLTREVDNLVANGWWLVNTDLRRKNL